MPEEEYIALASDRFKEVEGRKFKFQKLFPILQDVVKYSGGVSHGVPALHDGLLDHHRQPVCFIINRGRHVVHNLFLFVFLFVGTCRGW